QMTKHQQTIWHRTEMHSGIRGATSLLQQEVGQAGRVTRPTEWVTLNTAVNVPAGTFPCTKIVGGWTGGVTVPVQVIPAVVGTTALAGMWADVNNGIKLTVMGGDTSDT